MISRRAMLAGLGAFAASSARAAEGVDEDERTALLAHLRQVFVGTDVLAFSRRALTDAGLKRWIPEVEALLADREHLRGARSLQALGADPSFQKAAAALGERMSHDLRTELRVRHLARSAPQTRPAQQAALEWVEREWFGLQLDRIRAHLATYPEGLLVVFGPPTDAAELLASVAREPLLRYFELVHRRRARTWVANVDPRRELLEGLVDPAIRVVAFVGHGAWTGFSLAGLTCDPAAGLNQICRALRDNPKETVPKLLANKVWGIVTSGYAPSSAGLDESDLALLVRQLHPGGLPEPKDLVVRYTCGVGRYDTDADLLLDLLPAEERHRIQVWNGDLSAKVPTDEGTWEPPLAEWLADKAVTLTDQTALGTCLVARPEDTRGYAGNSWLPDFVEDPVPAWMAPYPFAPEPDSDPHPDPVPEP